MLMTFCYILEKAWLSVVSVLLNRIKVVSLQESISEPVTFKLFVVT